MLLTVFALEEVGKAHIGLEYLNISLTRKAYVDFNARFHAWQMPMTTNPNSIVNPTTPSVIRKKQNNFSKPQER